ncbi:MAG: hypothetical protein ACOC1K_01720, partial [Nanoarchaeota archaeon]
AFILITTIILVKEGQEEEELGEACFVATVLNLLPAILFYLTLESAILKLFATEWQVIELIVQKIGG